jgi:hypothetical protein
MPQKLIGHQTAYPPKNLLMNGDFEVWQRGTPRTLAPGGGFGPDEWQANGNTSVTTLTLTKELSTIKRGLASLKMDVTLGAATNVGLKQGIESYKALEGLTLTFSAWIKSSLAAAINLYIADYTTAQESVRSPHHSGSGEWELLTVSKTIRAGLSNPANPNTWPHGFAVRALIYATANGTYYIDSAALVVGRYLEGAPFTSEHPADERSRCERFYQASNGANAVASGNVTSGTGYRSRQLCLSTEMQATPTVTLTNVTNTRYPATVGTVDAVGPDGFVERRVANATGAGDFESSWAAEVV